MKKPTTRKSKGSKASKQRQHGVNLLDYDTSDDLELVDEFDINPGRIQPAVKRAIIAEHAQGVPRKVLALKYDVSEATVNRIWKEFIQEASDLKLLTEEEPQKFHSRIRAKAVRAIEAGLDHDQDPYRQGALGVQVMKGIGEFKGDHDSGQIKVNVMINTVPPEWKARYIGADVVDQSPAIGALTDGKSSKDDTVHS